MYNNGQRPQKMYGGGMTMPRKPMMMGGLAEKNRTTGSATPKTQDAMGMMTQQKRFDMGYKYGGKTGGIPKTPKQKKFAALAEPKDRITLADRIKGAKT